MQEEMQAAEVAVTELVKGRQQVNTATVTVLVGQAGTAMATPVASVMALESPLASLLSI